MTNFERIIASNNPEELTYIFHRLQRVAIYANGRLLDSSPDDFMEWLNKESDSLDDSIFNMALRKCPKCGSLPSVETFHDGSVQYICRGCGHNKYDYEYTPRSIVAAKLKWNY